MKFICGFCGSFAFEEEKGDVAAGLSPALKLDAIPESWRCPVCGHWKGNLKEISEAEYPLARAKYKRNYPSPTDKPTKDTIFYRDLARKQLSREVNRDIPFYDEWSKKE